MKKIKNEVGITYYNEIPLHDCSKETVIEGLLKNLENAFEHQGHGYTGYSFYNVSDTPFESVVNHTHRRFGKSMLLVLRKCLKQKENPLSKEILEGIAWVMKFEPEFNRKLLTVKEHDEILKKENPKP